MKKYAKYAVAAALVAMGAYQANAMTVNWGDAFTPITYNDGITALPTGSTQVSIGLDGSANLAGFTLWSAGADVGGNGNTGGHGTMGDGAADGFFTDSNSGPGVGFFNQQIYVEVGAGNMLVTNPGWKFGSTDSSVSNIDFGDAGLVILVGSYSTGTAGDPYTGMDAIVTDIPAPVVPEPSSIMLVVLGLLGSIGLIRRRS